MSEELKLVLENLKETVKKYKETCSPNFNEEFFISSVTDMALGFDDEKLRKIFISELESQNNSMILKIIEKEGSRELERVLSSKQKGGIDEKISRTAIYRVGI